MEWELAAEARQVRDARALIRSFLADRARDPDDEDVGRVVLAVSEAVSNVVMHAYRDAPAGVGAVWLSAALEADDLVVTVRDDGVGLRPRDDSPGAGFGLLLIERLSSGLSTAAGPSGGTTVTMRFALS